MGKKSKYEEVHQKHIDLHRQYVERELFEAKIHAEKYENTLQEAKSHSLKLCEQYKDDGNVPALVDELFNYLTLEGHFNGRGKEFGSIISKIVKDTMEVHIKKEHDALFQNSIEKIIKID